MKGPRLIARALIVDDRRLLVNRHKRRLALFGGRVEKGESARRALERELGEELGLRVEVGALAFVVENFFVDERERRVHELGLYYRVRRIGSGEIEARERRLRPMWLPLAELASSELRPRALRDRLAQSPPTLGDDSRGPIELVEIDHDAFPEML